MTFGKLAELLAGHVKGESVSATGRFEKQIWNAPDGTQRETFQLIANDLHSARTIRPRGGKAKAPDKAARPHSAPEDPAPFDDPLPF